MNEKVFAAALTELAIKPRGSISHKVAVFRMNNLVCH